jgi:hypothetical protein
MTTQVLDLEKYYTPHWGQKNVHASDARVKILKIGRRWGKGRFSLWEMIRRYIESLETPRDSSLIPSWHCWIVCPSYPQARQVWNELITFLNPLPYCTAADMHQDERMIYLRGGEDGQWGLIEVKSAHLVDGLQTTGLDFLWMQESQDIADTAFEKVLPATRSPGRSGYAVFEGIPSMYSSHWFERTFRAAQDGRENYEAWNYSAFDNPLLHEPDNAWILAEIEADKEILPERAWRRMYLAEFNEDAGYFSNVSACIGGDILSGPLPGVGYVAGLDLGRKMDASVLIIMDASDRRVVAHWAWDDGASWVTQRESIVHICQEWEVQRLVIDATGMGGDMFTSEMAEANLPVEPFIITSASREALLQELVIALERRTVSFPNITALLRQLRAFQYRRLPSGRLTAEAPPGEHDDEVFALGLALTACAAPPSSTAMKGPRYEGRYVPTQAEANSKSTAPALRSYGAKMLRERRLARTQERMDQAGVT